MDVPIVENTTFENDKESTKEKYIYSAQKTNTEKKERGERHTEKQRNGKTEEVKQNM